MKRLNDIICILFIKNLRSNFFNKKEKKFMRHMFLKK